MPYTVPVSTYPLLQDPPFVIGVVWLGVALGYRLLRLLRVPLKEATPLEKGVVSAALGCGLLQYVAFGLGMVNMLTPRSVWIVLALLVALLMGELVRVARSGWNAFQRVRTHPPPRWIQLGTLLLVIPLFVALLQALCPPTDVDGLGYHLTGPKRWLQAGSLTYLPTMLQTQWPMGVEMLFVLPMAVWSDTAAKLIHYALGIWTLLAVFALGTRLRSPAVGFMAASLFILGLPRFPALPEFAWAYIDLGLSLQITCAVLAWFLWRSSRQRGWLLCAALCAGFAATSKLNGIFIGLLLGGLVYTERRRAKEAGALQEATLLFGVALVPVLPWLIRAWVLTQNPVWPLLIGLFPHTRDWSPEAGAIFDIWAKYYVWAPERGGDLAQRKMLLNVALLCVALTSGLLYWRWKERDARALLLVVAGMALVMIATTGLYQRYFLPFIPLALLLIGLALTRPLAESRPLQAAILLIITLNGLLYLARSQPNMKTAVSVALAHTPRSDYLARELPIWSLWDFANTHLPPDAKILAASTAATYYSDRYCFLSDSYRQYHIRLNTWETFLSDLQRDQIRYAVVPATIGKPTFGPPSIPAQNEFPFARRLVDTYGTLLFTIGNDQLYQLRWERALGVGR